MTDDDVGDGPGRSPLADGAAAAAFGRLFDDHAAPLHAYLASRIGRTPADDLVAEVFLIAYRDRERFDPSRGTARSWLYGIATNLARRHLRSEVRALSAIARWGSAHRERADGPDGRVPDRVDAAAQVGRLAGRIGELPDGDREVLLLTAWGGLSTGEVAAALDIPVGTVRSRLHRVRGHLRAVLDGAGLDETTEEAR